jgi:hypothetical protein
MSNSDKNIKITIGSRGLTFWGVTWRVIAAICSWTINHSIIWAVIHAFFGPFYILYLCMGCGGGIPHLSW